MIATRVPQASPQLVEAAHALRSELQAARELLATLDRRPLPRADHFAIRVRVLRIDRLLGRAAS